MKKPILPFVSLFLDAIIMLLAINFNNQLDSLVQIVEDYKIAMRAGCKNEVNILEV